MDIWLVVISILFGSYVLSGVLKKLNEWYILRYLGASKQSVPPGDFGWPVIGNLLPLIRAVIASNPDILINYLINSNGKTGIYKFSIFGSPTVIVCAQETNRPVLMDDEKFELGYLEPSLRILGLWHSAAPPQHKRLRKLMSSPINGHEALSLYIGYIETAAMAGLDEWSRRDKPIKFLCEAERITFKIISRIFLGNCSDSFIDSMKDYYTDLSAGLLLPVAINLPGFAYRRAVKARKVLDGIMKGVLDDIRRSNGRKNKEKGMIDLMMEVDDEESGRFSDEEIIELLIVFLFAGHDSIAHACMWVTAYLHQHPEVLQKAKEEQINIVKRRPASQKGLTLAEIREMKYLSQVINETLRSCSLSIPLFRRTKTDVNISGYLVPKGWRVIVWNKTIHTDSKFYPNPYEFLPQRWDNFRPKAGTFMPFGAGSHICPGADLAKLEVSIFLHCLLLNYKFERMNPNSPWVYLPFPRPSDNCVAKFTKLPTKLA